LLHIPKCVESVVWAADRSSCFFFSALARK